jgi:hypothetical protein
MFSVVLLVFGRPECSSTSIDTRLTFKRECHLKTAAQLKECSPKASRSTIMVSVEDLLCLTQNLMQTRCSILPPIAEKKLNTKSKRHLCVKTMHVHMAGLPKCDIDLSSHLSPRQLQ